VKSSFARQFVILKEGCRALFLMLKEEEKVRSPEKGMVKWF